MDLYQASAIKKIYKTGSVDLAALQGVSFDIPDKSFLALVGPSGSGKSTLLNLLGLLEHPSEGQLKFDGIDIVSTPETTLTKIRRETIGFIFQNFNLISILSAVENVEYPLLLQRRWSRQQTRKMATELIEQVGLGPFGHHNPSQLSGGQRQRVAVARALIKRPKVILADEPMANLDSQTSQQILTLMKNLQKEYGTTLIIASHDKEIAAMADRRITIKDGLVASDDRK